MIDDKQPLAKTLVTLISSGAEDQKEAVQGGLECRSSRTWDCISTTQPSYPRSFPCSA